MITTMCRMAWMPASVEGVTPVVAVAPGADVASGTELAPGATAPVAPGEPVARRAAGAVARVGVVAADSATPVGWALGTTLVALQAARIKAATAMVVSRRMEEGGRSCGFDTALSRSLA